ncbi:hypothetical protein H4Q26_010650 [Puccinia striiformis f. sp. tritici PST-130]|nr:hypothetical protein H4Q26_010650 [Puccinia striiformis f. sp. tritici PST-130]
MGHNRKTDNMEQHGSLSWIKVACSSDEPHLPHPFKQLNKVIWVDIGLNPKETYWWPAVVYEHNLKSHVALIADSKIDGRKINPKLLDSVKDTKQFKMYLAFKSTKSNPILNMRELATK